jgi:hypothetical protein
MSYYEFARKRGSRDKKRRKKRISQKKTALKVGIGLTGIGLTGLAARKLAKTVEARKEVKKREPRTEAPPLDGFVTGFGSEIDRAPGLQAHPGSQKYWSKKFLERARMKQRKKRS